MNFRRVCSSVVSHAQGRTWKVIGMTLDRKMAMIELKYKKRISRDRYVRTGDLNPEKKISKITLYEVEA